MPFHKIMSVSKESIAFSSSHFHRYSQVAIDTMRSQAIETFLCNSFRSPEDAKSVFSTALEETKSRQLPRSDKEIRSRLLKRQEDMTAVSKFFFYTHCHQTSP